MKTVTLGGNRLGSGKKQKVTMHGFERSTHDLGHVFRTTMAPGTLVPFLNLLALPGDNFDINLAADVKTHPTLGPLFASFKLQLDVFQCPIRLYHAWLHNNKMKIGLDMSKVKLPLMNLVGNPLRFDSEMTTPLEFQQINQSALLAYLGIRGIGNGYPAHSKKLAIPYLAYWDIYKQYYANQQEEIGYMIHSNNTLNTDQVFYVYDGDLTEQFISNGYSIRKIDDVTGWTVKVHVPVTKTSIKLYVNWYYDFDIEGVCKKFEPQSTEIVLSTYTEAGGDNIFETALPMIADYGPVWLSGFNVDENKPLSTLQESIKLTEFPLENIDKMRENILAHDGTNYFEINANTLAPYGLPISDIHAADSQNHMCSYASQEGLAIKTYQSDLFNNWMNTEWIDGENGINAVTSIDTSGGSFELDTLNLAKKVYDMLNRIAISGGTYNDWMESVYDHDGYRKAETPMYMGGLSKEIVFQEVVSTTAAKLESEEQSLGALGGRGTLSNKHKGGSVNVRVDEPSFIIGIVSITPRVDYYQGNDWTTLLKTMDDLHKPGLDEIGYQDLITDQMAYWDTVINEDESLTLKSAGKQPAWLNYMTAYNRLYGNFADERNEMYMTLPRRYEANEDGSIKDLTTYIDPSKYNYAFAQTDLTAQNFWVQIGMDITARRKMSARLMPNL